MAKRPYDCAEIPARRRTPQGVCRDFSASYEAEDRDAYIRRVKECEALWAEDSDEARRRGCKRIGHIPIRRGRLSFKDKGRSPDDLKLYSPRASTDERWRDKTRPFDARTQSLRSQAWAHRTAKAGTVEKLTSEIAAGLSNYERAEQKKRGGIEKNIFLPKHPSVLEQYGVPSLAAAYIVRRLGGRAIPVRPRRDVTSLQAALSRAFGNAELDAKGFDLHTESFKASSARGPVRSLRGFLKRARASKSGKIQVIDGEVHEAGDVTELSIWGRTFGDQLVGLSEDLRNDAIEPPWRLVLGLEDSAGNRAVVSLTDAQLFRATGSEQGVDYETLRGFALSELPSVVARKLISPRKKRKGRQRKARENRGRRR